jgi:CRP-like cAMP-binding protein
MGGDFLKHNSEVRESLVEALSQSSILQFLGKHDPKGHELRAMLKRGELRHFEGGQPIIKEGEAGDVMYLLIEGTVTVSLEGTEVCVMDEPGDVFGEFGAVTGELRSASVTARDAVTCFVVSAQLTLDVGADGNALFDRLLRQALINLLLARLRKSNEDLLEARKAVAKAENQCVFLRMDNESLNHELEAARTALRDRTRNDSDGQKGE